MQYMQKYITGTLLLLITISLAVSYHLFSLRREGVPILTHQSTNSKKVAEYWTTRLRTIGAEQAYEDLKLQYERSENSVKHAAAHLFGKQLFIAMGISGLTICDNDLTFGCYHGFLSAAFMNNGLTMLDSANKECMNKFGADETGCRHGIGHGVAEFLGQKRLPESLEACNKLQKLKLTGCYSGVFMEYFQNLPTSTIDLHKPCNVESKYKPSCYFEVSYWWLRSTRNDFKGLYGLCGELTEISVKNACLKGIGRSVGDVTNYNQEKIREMCGEMIVEDRFHCFAGASWVFGAVGKQGDFCRRSEQPLVCEQLRRSIEEAV
jgi:hypothetical protein